MNEKLLDEQMKRLAIIAQHHPLQSKERRQAVGKLIGLMGKSGKFRAPDGNFSKEVYEEAVQNLFIYIYENIEKYSPSRGSFMAWVRMLFHKDFLQKAFKERTKESSKLLNAGEIDVDSIYLPEQLPLSEQLREFIELDPDDLFKREYISPNQAANFQNLMKRRLAKESWSDISKDWGIKAPTLSSFYQRAIKKFAVIFQEYFSG